MKTLLKLLTIIIFALPLTQCKKKDVKPSEPDPPVICTPEAEDTRYTGKYVSSKSDTIVISFVKHDCNTNQVTYKITNLSKAFGAYAIQIKDKDYILNVDNVTKTGEIPDTMKYSISTIRADITMKNLASGYYELKTFAKRN